MLARYKRQFTAEKNISTLLEWKYKLPSYKSDLSIEFPPFPRLVKYSLKWCSKMNLSISDICLPLSPRESWSKTSRILSFDHDEIVSRKSALIHPKSMKASIKWVIGGIEASRKLWMSRYCLGSCVVQVISGSKPIKDSFDRGRVREADSGATFWLATLFCWFFFGLCGDLRDGGGCGWTSFLKLLRRVPWSSKTKRIT